MPHRRCATDPQRGSALRLAAPVINLNAWVGGGSLILASPLARWLKRALPGLLWPIGSALFLGSGETHVGRPRHVSTTWLNLRGFKTWRNFGELRHNA